MKAQVDGLAADNSLLKTRVDSLVAEVTQLKADQAKAQELCEKHQAEAELKEESLRQRLQTAIDSLRSNPVPCLYCDMLEYSLFADHVFVPLQLLLSWVPGK
jgi:hypothetical protein